MEKEYAQALLKMGSDPTKAVKMLHNHLVRTGRTTLWSRIAKALLRISQEQERRERMTLTVARESDIEPATQQVRHLMSYLSKTSDVLLPVTVAVDNSLIGGWRLEGHEILIDTSYKKQLLNLFNRVTTK